MYTPPYTPYASPSQTGPRAYDDLLDFALERIENEGDIQEVARRLLFPEDGSTQPSSPPPSRPAAASSASPFEAPSTPKTTPIKRKRNPGPESSPSSFSTPPPRGHFSVAHPITPGFALKKPRDENSIFPGEILTTTNDLSPINLEAPFSIHVVYQDQNGHNHNLFKQPEGSKSCWAYSFAMLLSDLIRSGNSLKLDKSFWNWFQSAYLLKDEEVQEQAAKMGVILENTSIPFENPLVPIREQIATSGFPVLTTINHQIFSGHAIIVDSITDTHTTLRDPYSGKPWKVPNEKMESYYKPEVDNDDEEIDDEANQICLSVKPA